MVTSVKKMESGKFLLNDAVVISSIDIDSEGLLTGDLDFDGSMVNEEQANDIAQEFVLTALDSYLKKDEK